MSFHPTTAYDEGQLYTDRAPDGQTSFHTTLQMVTKQGCKPLPVKVDPGADINTIPLTHYKTIFPQHFTRDGHLKRMHYEAQPVPGHRMMDKENIS